MGAAAVELVRMLDVQQDRGGFLIEHMLWVHVRLPEMSR